MDTRERLVAATQELLWERGYAATSPKDMQAAAQAGQGSMYHHFRGKEGLAVAALERSADEMRRDAEALLSGPGTATERLEGYLRRQRDSLRGCRMGRMTFDPDVVATPALLQPVATTLDWLVNEIATVVRRGVEDGELAADVDAVQLASLVVAVVQGGYVLARAQGDAGPFDAAIDGAVSLLARVAAA
jgi:AcrR family transcriptional regulator